MKKNLFPMIESGGPPVNGGDNVFQTSCLVQEKFSLASHRRLIPKDGLLLFLLLLGLIQGAFATVYTSTQPGNWSSSATWGGNTPPGSSIGANDVVNIRHAVVYNLGSDLEIYGLLDIRSGSFTVPLGNNRSVFIKSGGEFFMCNAFFSLPIFQGNSNLSGNFSNENGTVTIISSTFEVAQNWEDKSSSGGGTRTVTNSCLRVGENFSNKGANDTYEGMCMEYGLHGSGNVTIQWV